MINNDWERFGDEIRRTIQNAVDSQDFSRLNQTVSDTIGKAMDSVSRGVKNGGWYRQKDDNMARGAAGVDMESVFGSGVRRNSSAQHAAPAKKLLYLKGTSTRIGGIFLAVTGYIFTAGALAFLLFLRLEHGAESRDGGLRTLRPCLCRDGAGRYEYGLLRGTF